MTRWKHGRQFDSPLQGRVGGIRPNFFPLKVVLTLAKSVERKTTGEGECWHYLSVAPLSVGTERTRKFWALQTIKWRETALPVWSELHVSSLQIGISYVYNFSITRKFHLWKNQMARDTTLKMSYNWNYASSLFLSTWQMLQLNISPLPAVLENLAQFSTNTVENLVFRWRLCTLPITKQICVDEGQSRLGPVVATSSGGRGEEPRKTRCSLLVKTVKQLHGAIRLWCPPVAFVTKNEKYLKLCIFVISTVRSRTLPLLFSWFAYTWS